MKTILITGATGFLGSHLIHRLHNHYNLILLTRSFSKTWRINDLLPKVNIYHIDAINLEFVFKNHRIDTVLHTATNYGRKGEKISHIIDSNFLFPLKLIELSKSFKVTRFINTDTFLKRNMNPYTLSKKQFLDWIHLFSNELNIINMKLEHIYGPRDEKHKFVPFIIDKLLKNESIDLTYGHQKRDFIFIDDVVEAYAKILDHKIVNHTFSEFEIGSGKPITIRNFVKLAHQLCSSKSEINFGVLPVSNNEIMESKANISLLKKIGWKPEISLEKGLSRIITHELTQ